MNHLHSFRFSRTVQISAFAFSAFACGSDTFSSLGPADSSVPPVSGGSLDGGADAMNATDANTGAMTVNGTVYSEDKGGQLLAGEKVVIVDKNAKTATATTDANGAFVFPNIQPPYDLAVSTDDPSAGLNGIAFVFLGLTTSSPAVFSSPSLESPTIIRTQTFSRASGTDYFTASLSSPDEFRDGTSIANVSNGTGNWTLQWAGPSSTQATIYFYFDVQGYSFLSTSQLKLTDGSTIPTPTINYTMYVDGQDLAMSAQTALGTPSLEMDIVFDDLTSTLRASLDAATTTCPFTTIPGVKYRVTADASANGAESKVSQILQGTETSTNIVLPAPFSLIAPDDLTAGLAATTSFSWEAADSKAVYLLNLEDTTHDTAINILTSGTSVSLARLTLLGIKLPDTSAFKWFIRAFEPFDSIDALAIRYALATATTQVTPASRTFTTP